MPPHGDARLPETPSQPPLARAPSLWGHLTHVIVPPLTGAMTTATPIVYVNMSRLDRAIRLLVGLLALVLGLVFGSWWGLVGLAPLVSGLFGFCPLYRLFGASTARRL